jgi:hypothetical protein
MTEREREVRSLLVVADVHLKLRDSVEAQKAIREAIALLDGVGK